MPRLNLIQIRGGTAASWTSSNPVLAAREPGLETDTLKMKYGDGTTAWNSLAYASGGGGSGTVESVTGDGVDNTDPDNPVLSFPTPGDIGAEVAGAAATVASNLSAHIADTTDAHAASAITNTPAGNISATTVQAAINELDTEKAPLASPTFTGIPVVPTAAPGTNTTQAASTAFVQQELNAAISAGTRLFNYNNFF